MRAADSAFMDPLGFFGPGAMASGTGHPGDLSLVTAAAPGPATLLDPIAAVVKGVDELPGDVLQPHPLVGELGGEGAEAREERRALVIPAEGQLHRDPAHPGVQDP